MKKTLLATIALAVGLSFSIVSVPQPVEASKQVKYKNCKALNAVYKNGVSKAKGTKNKVVNQKTKKATYKNSSAYASPSLYKLNIHLDNDKDGIACEK
ncbi:MAG: excalibur calcium-binding domain-containing protein [Lysinibacillus sp.]